MAKYTFDRKPPNKSEKGVMSLQRFLLRKAEEKFGSRDTSKTLGKPEFENHKLNYEGKSPFLMNSFDGTNAWAILSPNAANNWNIALYELAHETIHLLDPVKGYTNYLEEGVAVAFSEAASKEYTTHPMTTKSLHYLRALKLVKMLPQDFNTSIRAIREKCGSLGKATVSDLSFLFPDLDIAVAKELCSECNFK